MQSIISFIFLVLSLVPFGQGETQERVLYNVTYGPDVEQLLDLYLPDNDTIQWNKVILMLHGGSWVSGKKEHINGQVRRFRDLLPDYVIANMDYRLGTYQSPGFPKQVEDVQMAVSFLKASFPTTSLSFTLFGTSAGAHISLLYAYGRDRDIGDVKVVVDHIGPVDFMDPGYCDTLIVRPVLMPLFGNRSNCQEYPETWREASPLTYAGVGSPATIGFYGDADLVVPFGQMVALQERLDQAGVPNQFTRYAGGHGDDWAAEDVEDMWRKIAPFVELHS
ncbi:uncharacterized protein LOC110855720 [Folsomia candida]|uniref:uncharacterized protein LOC110855720 n=1 Tax=Folsomia candida TaxID=158441 RepID=UPI000B8F02E8|nr:uncharacterized protein LOC110855720 [Folsomia candida]